MAKLFPSQWRTVAPIVGRTAAQCMEHYEYLLDAAQAASGDDGGLAGAADARKLRPGEIDPHPETKPARPDPIDMDEDEKEMLAEARARLANTRGKKAKRKAREKQLEEAKRLANLQKRRELKAAGVEKKAGRKKRKHVDYGAEIPFQRPVPTGFYAVGDEVAASRQLSKVAAGKDFEVQRLDQMEGKRREKEEEEAKRADRKKIRKIEGEDPAAIMAAVSRANDPLAFRARSELVLPAPQVTDAELEQVLKVGAMAMVAGAGAGAGGATSGLVGDYASRAALPTPLRTPRAAEGSDVVLQEARNQLAMLATQTPLLGGVNPELLAGTGFAGSAPAGSGQASTPSGFAQHLGTPGATPLAGNGGGLTPRATPGGGGSAGGATPLRDDLGMNAMGPAGQSEAARLKHQRAMLAMSLSGLPEPQYAYEIEVPELAGKSEAGDGRGGSVGSSAAVEDASEVDARRSIAEAAAVAAEAARRSAAVRRGLPRPALGATAVAALAADTAEGGRGAADGEDTALSAAGGAVRREMAALLAHDSAKWPFGDERDRGGGKEGKAAMRAKRAAAAGAAPLEVLDDALLAAARAAVADELAADAGQGAVAAALAAGSSAASSEAVGAWGEALGSLAWLPERGAFGALATASAKERLSSLTFQFEAARGHMASHAERCAKLERKLLVKTQGYADKASALRGEVAAAHGAWDKRSIESLCFASLAAGEARALPQRLHELYDQGKREAERNAALQADYKCLLAERDRFYAMIAHAEGATA